MKIITNKTKIELEKGEKEKINYTKIINYLKNRQETGTLNQYDTLLLNYSPLDEKERIKSQLNLW